MDNNLINNFINQSEGSNNILKSKNKNSPNIDDNVDKNFEELFKKEEEKSSLISKKEKRDNESSIIEGKESKGNQKKKKLNKKEASKSQENSSNLPQDLAERFSDLSPMLNYLYNLMYKNPDAMTLLEKKAAGLNKTDIAQNFDVDIKKFINMLAKRGLKLKDLSLNKLAKLVQCKNKNQIDALLDKLLKEKMASKSNSLKQNNKKINSSFKENIEIKIAPNSMPNNDISTVLQAHGAYQQQQIEKAQKQRKIIDHIIKQINVKNLEGQTELVMKLNPEYMGELQLKLNYSGDKVNALFETTSKELSIMLSNSIDDLEKGFEKKGIKLGNTKVSLITLINSSDEESSQGRAKEVIEN